MKNEGTRIRRKKAMDMEEVVDMYIKSMKLASGLNNQRIFEAWDRASGAAQYTTGRFFRGGKLYITLSSSMARTQLYLQKDVILKYMNDILAQDPLFTRDDSATGFVKEIVLK